MGCVKAQLNDISGEAELRVRFSGETDIGVKFTGYMQTPELRALLIPIMQQQLELTSYKYERFKICPNCNTAADKLTAQLPFLYQCATCHKKWCSDCGDWHPADATECTQQGDIKRCPRCKVPTDKVGSSNHIICPCGCHWCYVCGKEFSKNTIYKHMTEAHGG